MKLHRLLALPPDLETVHFRVVATRKAHPGEFLYWSPRSAQQRVAISESDEAINAYTQNRLLLEHKAKWAGIKRNARRFVLPKRIAVLVFAHLKYKFGWTKIGKLILKLLFVGGLITSVVFALSKSSINEVIFKTSDLVTQRLLATGVVLLHGEEKSQLINVPVSVKTAANASTEKTVSQIVIDPALLADSSAEPGLPLKLSCAASSFKTETKANP